MRRNLPQEPGLFPYENIVSSGDAMDERFMNRLESDSFEEEDDDGDGEGEGEENKNEDIPQISLPSIPDFPSSISADQRSPSEPSPTPPLIPTIRLSKSPWPMRVRTLRRIGNYTQTDIASHLRVTRGFVSLLERGERQPSTMTQFHIAELAISLHIIESAEQWCGGGGGNGGSDANSVRSSLSSTDTTLQSPQVYEQITIDEEMDVVVWSQRTKKLRSALGMTVKQFSHHLGFSLLHVRRWEDCVLAPSTLARNAIMRVAEENDISWKSSHLQNVFSLVTKYAFNYCSQQREELEVLTGRPWHFFEMWSRGNRIDSDLAPVTNEAMKELLVTLIGVVAIGGEGEGEGNNDNSTSQRDNNGAPDKEVAAHAKGIETEVLAKQKEAVLDRQRRTDTLERLIIQAKAETDPKKLKDYERTITKLMNANMGDMQENEVVMKAEMKRLEDEGEGEGIEAVIEAENESENEDEHEHEEDEGDNVLDIRAIARPLPQSHTAQELQSNTKNQSEKEQTGFDDFLSRFSVSSDFGEGEGDGEDESDGESDGEGEGEDERDETDDLDKSS